LRRSSPTIATARSNSQDRSGKRYRSNRSEGQRLHTLLRFELDLWARAYVGSRRRRSGHGAVAGPVVAGAVILPQNYKLRGLNDSKKILDQEKRDELAFRSSMMPFAGR